MPFLFFIPVNIRYCLCGQKSVDYLMQFLLPFPDVTAERIGKLVPVVVIEQFHSQRIIVKEFSSALEDTDMVTSDIHGLQAVSDDNLMESLHRGEVASSLHN